MTSPDNASENLADNASDKPAATQDAQDAQTFTVDDALAGQRLDAIVAKCVGISVGAAKRAIAAGQVTMNGRRVKKGAPAIPGATLAYVAGPGSEACRGEAGVAMAASRPKPAPEPAEFPGLSLEVLVETEDFVAVNKPAGVPCQPTHAHPACLAGSLIAAYPDCAAAGPSAGEGGLVHRLDTGTSGVLVAARTPQAWEDLRKVFGGDNAGFGGLSSAATSTCQKTYLAGVARGSTAPRPDATALARMDGAYEDIGGVLVVALPWPPRPPQRPRGAGQRPRADVSGNQGPLVVWA